MAGPGARRIWLGDRPRRSSLARTRSPASCPRRGQKLGPPKPVGRDDGEGIRDEAVVAVEPSGEPGEKRTQRSSGIVG